VSAESFPQHVNVGVVAASEAALTAARTGLLVGESFSHSGEPNELVNILLANTAE